MYVVYFFNMLSCDSGTEEITTNAAIMSIGYILMGFDVLACDKYGYSVTLYCS